MFFKIFNIILSQYYIVYIEYYIDIFINIYLYL